MAIKAKLTKREKEVIDLLMEGKFNREIASALQISENTVESHLKSIFRKLKVRSRVEVIILFTSQSESTK